MTEMFPSLHGAASRRHVKEALGERSMQAALRSGVLVQPWRGVIILGSRQLELLTRAAAASIAVGPDGVLSRNTAAEIHGCGAAASQSLHVTVPYSSWVKSRKGLVVHHSRFDRSDIVYRDELPLLALDAVLEDILCTESRWTALACLDQALAKLSDEQAAELIDSVDQRLAVREDRRGVPSAESLLCLGSSKSESPQESRLRLLVVDAGFPQPVPQYEIRTLSGNVLYRLDLAWPQLRIALEYDGYEAHELREAADAERDRRMAGRGWVVIRVRSGDFKTPARLMGELREAFRLRRFPLSG